MDERSGRLEILSERECLSLLGSTSVGRISYTDRALPAIAVVNYVVHDGMIVFRSLAGSKLAAAMRRDVVAFEADAVDPVTGTGWSVVIVGEARTVRNRHEADLLALLPLRSWVNDPWPDVFVQIGISVITGRRIKATRRIETSLAADG
jgi:uncharacterized protein